MADTPPWRYEDQASGLDPGGERRSICDSDGVEPPFGGADFAD